MEVKRQNASLLSEAAVNARMRTLKQMVVAAARSGEHRESSMAWAGGSTEAAGVGGKGCWWAVARVGTESEGEPVRDRVGRPWRGRGD